MIAITGAGGGVGAYLFARYAESGQKVFGTCHSSEPADERMTRLDVVSFESLAAWATRVAAADPGEMTLINCAAVSYSTFAHKSDPAAWARVVETNLVGTYNAIRAFLPMMRERNFGRIVNFSSVVAETGVVGTSAYAASKSALWGLAKALCAESARKRITVNSINLGYADIGMGLSAIGDAQRRELLERIPAGRFCSPEEIYATVEFLRSVEYANGISVSLNGGLA